MTSVKYIGMDVHKESISIALLLRFTCGDNDITVRGRPLFERLG